MDETRTNQLARSLRRPPSWHGALPVVIGIVALLVLRGAIDAWPSKGWPPERDRSAPTLQQVLQRHPFLVHDEVHDRLSIPSGRHDLQEDLVTPPGRVLHVEPGTRLRLARDVVIAAAAIVVDGRSDAQVVMEPFDARMGWAGLLLLGGAGTSRLQHLVVQSATGRSFGPWQTSAAIRAHAPIELFDCTFRDTRCEDAVHVIGQRFRIERCTFERAASDMVDIDFGTGELCDCTFEGAGGDGVDLCGAQAEVKRCSFTNIGDKAVSAGERSRVAVNACRIRSAALGVVAKDHASVRVHDLDVADTEHFAFAAFQKKAAFGPGRIAVIGQRTTGQYLAQTGSVIVVDGHPVPTQSVDVAELYDRKVLGN